MRKTFPERIAEEGDGRFSDSAVVGHGFTPYNRDYDVVIQTVAPLPQGVPIGDTTGMYNDARYRYRFTHCTEARLTTRVSDEGWLRSWDDVFTDYAAWQAAGTPEGFVWGVDYADAYPGLSYVADSSDAAAWTQRTGRAMHEVMIETNTFVLKLICHDLRLDRLAVGDPITGEFSELGAPERL
jgi:hypothetical protein